MKQPNPLWWLRLNVNEFFKRFNQIKESHCHYAATVMLTLLQRVRFEPIRINGLDLERGQCYFGTRELANLTRLSHQVLRTVVKEMISCDHITIVHSSHKGTIVQINNFDKLLIDLKQNTPQEAPDIPEQPPQQPTDEDPPKQEQEPVKEFRMAGTLQTIQKQIGYCAPLHPSRDIPIWERILNLAGDDTTLIQQCFDDKKTVQKCRDANGAWPFIFKCIVTFIEGHKAADVEAKKQMVERRRKSQAWKKQLEPDYGRVPYGALINTQHA